jgi:hypothetical protein
MLREALDFPTSGDRGSAALLVGSVLLLLSVGFLAAGAILPLLLAVALAFQVALRGYYVRVLRVTAADRAPVAPSFGDVSSLLRDGLVAVAVAVAYFLPALLLFAVAAGGNLASAVQNPLQLRDPTTIAAAETVGGLAALLGLFAALGAFYLVPGAVTLYAHEGRVRSAFDLRTVFRGTVSEDYAVGWVITLVLQGLLFPVVALLYSLAVGVFLHFFLAVSVRYVWGTSFGNALDFEPPTVDREGITPDKSSGRPGSRSGADSSPWSSDGSAPRSAPTDGTTPPTDRSASATHSEAGVPETRATSSPVEDATTTGRPDADDSATDGLVDGSGGESMSEPGAVGSAESDVETPETGPGDGEAGPETGPGDGEAGPETGDAEPTDRSGDGSAVDPMAEESGS